MASHVPRSYLFVPANRPDRFAKACTAGADAVIIDLEDAVAPPDKPAAREAVSKWLIGSRPRFTAVYGRIHGADTEWFAPDLSICRIEGIAGIVLPKAEAAE